MNKYQWALHRLWSAINRNEYLIYDKQLMEELVEKATPKRPIGIDEALDSDFDMTYLVGLCPNCNSPVNEYQKGCSQCLQALDWSKEECQ